MNVILIVSDTFRYDFLGANGNKWMDTRDLDAFAKRCTVFDNCYTGSFPTIPHRTDMLTGRFLFPHGGWSPLRDDWISIGEYLQEANYVTQMICDTPHLLREGYNFSRGFAGYFWVRGQETDIPFTNMNYPVKSIMPPNKTRDDMEVTPVRPQGATVVDMHKWKNRNWMYEEDRFMTKTAKHAIRWLEDNYKAENFFLWVDFFDSHEPWDPPEYIIKQYHPGYRGIPMLHPNYGRADVYTKAELKNLKAHYAGEVTLVSKWIGQVLRKIEEVSLMDKTAIIFTSDHGTYLGEHNRTGKSNRSLEDKRGEWPLYTEVTHIPLMIYVPGIEPKRINNLVQPVDIMPTILELAGQKVPSSIDGKSLYCPIKGEKNSPREYVVSAYRYLKSSNIATIQDKEYSLVVRGGSTDTVELFDIRKDPQQTKNVIDKYPDRAKKLHKNFLEFFANKDIDMEVLSSKIRAYL